MRDSNPQGFNTQPLSRRCPHPAGYLPFWRKTEELNLMPLDTHRLASESSATLVYLPIGWLGQGRTADIRLTAGHFTTKLQAMVGKVRLELTQAHRPPVLQTGATLQLRRFPWPRQGELNPHLPADNGVCSLNTLPGYWCPQLDLN